MSNLRLERITVPFNQKTNRLDLPTTPPPLSEESVALWQLTLSLPPSGDVKAQRSLSRTRLLQILALYCDNSLTDVPLMISANGKPELRPEANPQEIQFSVSHCLDRMVVAVGKGRAIGVDIEKIRAHTKSLAIAQHYFSENEAKYLASLDGAKCNRDFIRLWTCKEAIVKALGTGMFQHMRTIEIDLRDEARIQKIANLAMPASSETAPPLSCWLLKELDLDESDEAFSRVDVGSELGTKAEIEPSMCERPETNVEAAHAAANKSWFGALALAPKLIQT